MEQWGQYMDLTKKELFCAYSPYRKEALYCLGIDGIVAFVCCAVFFLQKVHTFAPALFLIIPGYFILEMLINYRLAILSFIEERNQSYIQKEISIVGMKIEDSASGRWESAIPKLYAKNLRMNRYKIMCIDSNKEKISLRRVMSNKNAQLLSDKIHDESPLRRTVVIGKYSRIILKYCDKDDVSFVLSRTM